MALQQVRIVRRQTVGMSGDLFGVPIIKNEDTPILGPVEVDASEYGALIRVAADNATKLKDIPAKELFASVVAAPAVQ